MTDCLVAPWPVMPYAVDDPSGAVHALHTASSVGGAVPDGEHTTGQGRASGVVSLNFQPPLWSNHGTPYCN